MKMKTLCQLVALFLLSASFTTCEDDPSKEAPATDKAPKTGNAALEELSQKIAAKPADANLYAARAGIYNEIGGQDEAIADLQKAIALDSLNPTYYHALADIYLDYFKSRQALETMKKAAAVFPKRIPTLLKLSEFQWILKQYNDALFTLERIRAIDPQNAEMFFLFGNVFKEMGNAKRAINAFQSAVENDPDLVDAWINLGQLWSEKGEPIAEKFFDNALRVDSNNIEAIVAKAYYLANKKNDLPGAVKLYKKINVIDPQKEEGYYNLGLLYLDMDSLERAYQSFDLAVKVNPTFIMGYYYRGVAAEMKGDLANAKTNYEDVLNFAPDYEKAKKALERVNRAVGGQQ